MSNQSKSDSRIVPVASKFPRRVKKEVTRLAKEREWTLSKTILHLTERGLAQVNGERSRIRSPQLDA